MDSPQALVRGVRLRQRRLLVQARLHRPVLDGEAALRRVHGGDQVEVEEGGVLGDYRALGLLRDLLDRLDVGRLVLLGQRTATTAVGNDRGDFGGRTRGGRAGAEPACDERATNPWREDGREVEL